MTAAGGTACLRAVLSLGQGRLRVMRPLLVLPLVAGVLAMHALTVGHHPESALTSMPSAPASTSGMLETGHTAHGVAFALTETGLADADAADGCAGCGHEAPGSSHGGSHVLDLCLAILLAGAVTLLLLLGQRRRGRSVLLCPAPRQPMRSPSVSRLPGPPSLSRLCVLRT